MRNVLDELRFKMYDWSYSMRMTFERITDRTKYSALSFLVVLWLALCTYLFFDNYNYKAEEHIPIAVGVSTVAIDTLEQAEKWMELGSDAEAFDLLTTHRNHFYSNYTDKQMLRLESNLIELSKKASEADIAVLYSTKDLVEQQPLYKFIGKVIAVDNDPLYGVTHTVSNSEERSQEQLEVTGLTDISVGSNVEFFGVPKFDSVSSPIKVEAYVVPIEQEVLEDDGTK